MIGTERNGQNYMKSAISNAIDAISAELWEINEYMYQNPELGYEEKLACEKLAAYLKSKGFSVETGVAGLPTAFQAVYDSGKPGASVAFLCEYDALPDIGHGCGHNMVAVMGAGAGIGLKSVIEETGGKVYVFGTPAEESHGGKVVMTDAGLFDGMDFCLMLHPGPHSEESGEGLAMNAFEFNYHGKSAHASISPEQGISALDSVIHLFNGISTYRQFITNDARIHGVITDGGKAPNVIPDFASAKFYVRATTREYLDELNKRVLEIAEGAAKMTGATVEIKSCENSFDNLISNSAMSQAWCKNMRELGLGEISPAVRVMGSSDIGNVSQRVPTIHAFIGMDEPTFVWHTKEAADFSVGEKGRDKIIRGAKSLAYTGFDLLTDEQLAQKVKMEFSRRTERQ